MRQLWVPSAGAAMSPRVDGVLTQSSGHRMVAAMRSSSWLAWWLWAASVFFSSPVGAAPTVATGSYVGTGTATRNIAGLSFSPGALFLRQVGSQSPYIRMATMPINRSKQANGASALDTDRIVSFEADGFTAGASANALGTTYFWMAFRPEGGETYVGSYVGNGVDDRDVTVGFAPDAVVVVPAGSFDSLLHTNAMPADSAYDFVTDIEGQTNLIQGLGADGFQVGSAPGANAAGQTFHFIAWRSTPGRIAIGGYSGDGVQGRVLSIGLATEAVIVKGLSGSNGGVYRLGAMGASGGSSLRFAASTGASNSITELRTDGFALGTDPYVNSLSIQYTYLAFGNAEPTATPGGALTVPVGELALRFRVGCSASDFGVANGWPVWLWVCSRLAKRRRKAPPSH
jgi:hypothetical protein